MEKKLLGKNLLFKYLMKINRAQSIIWNASNNIETRRAKTNSEVWDGLETNKPFSKSFRQINIFI